MARITMREAISQALWEEMEHDPNVFIMGEEVGLWGGTYAVTKGFYDHFGAKRVRDTPISEAAIIGSAIGAALTGLRPIAELMTINFAFSAMDHIVISKEQVFPFGIPVALELEGKIDKDAARKRFGLSKKRISAVVMGSRVFGGEWFEIVKEIVDFDYDLLVLCGDNKDVMEKIKKLKGKSKLSTYGMVEHIHELIATTDILITKAGGITTTECTKVGPCLLFANSIVGLEDKNEDFFISHNAALKFTKENARSVMSDLLSHPKKITEMRSNLKNIGKRKTAINIAGVILGSGLNI